MRLIVDDMPRNAKECAYSIFNRRMDAVVCKLSEDICGFYSTERECDCLVHIDEIVCKRCKNHGKTD
jgi:hypothetical protein